MNRILRQFNLVFRDKNAKKSLPKMLGEIIMLSFKKREAALIYGGKFLYRKNIKNYKDYLSVKESKRLNASLNLQKPEYASILRNKLSFALFCARYGIATPALLSHNFGGRFFYNNEMYMVKDHKGIIDFFKMVLADSGEKKLFIKALTAKGGQGCYILSLDNLGAKIKSIGEDLLNTSFIHQKIIVQHPEIDKIHSGCINSLRFITYIDREGVAHIVSVLMRFGSGDRVVDNASAGGFYVAIDLNTGKLSAEGHQFMRGGGNLVTAHPDSGCTFRDFEIPYFAEACALVLKATRYLPTRWVGWDIAIQPGGPTLIEGNDNPGMLTADIAYGGYLGHPLVREVVEESRVPNQKLMKI